MKSSLLTFVLLVLIQFTDPSGRVVWVNPESVNAVLIASGCSTLARARIIVGGQSFCVAEEIGDVKRKVEGK